MAAQNPTSKSHFVVAELAAEKAKRTSIAEKEWADVLQRGLQGLRGQDVELEGLEQVAQACSTPRQFALMVRLISQHCRGHGQGKKVFELIRQNVSTTVFSLAEWIESLEYFTDWLEKNGEQIDFLNMLNYLQCCTHLPDAKTPGAKLKPTLVESIQKFGVTWTGLKK